MNVQCESGKPPYRKKQAESIRNSSSLKKKLFLYNCNLCGYWHLTKNMQTKKR